MMSNEALVCHKDNSKIYVEALSHSNATQF